MTKTLGIAMIAAVFMAASPTLSIDAQAQGVKDRMQQLGSSVANSGMVQKAMNAVQAELAKCMKTVVADEAVMNTAMGGDYRAAALEAMRACIDRVEAGEFSK